MNSNFILSLIFAGIIQGVFLGIFILTSKKHKSKASLYLGLLILCFTLSNLQYVADEIDLVDWDTFNLIYLPYLFFTAPFLYFFVCHYLDPQRVNKKKERLLYIPAIAALIITLTHKTITLATGDSYKENTLLDFLGDLIDVYGDFVNILLFLIVVTLLLLKLNNYSKKRISSGFIIAQSQLIWLKLLLFVFFIILIPWLFFTYNYLHNEEAFYLPMYLIASFIIYLLGYIGIHKIGVLNERKKIRASVSNIHKDSNTEKPKNEHIAQLEKIIHHDKGFLNPNLTLDNLAEELQLSKSHLSRIINSELNSTFTNYINSLRIAEAKKLLLNPEFSNYTLVAIGLESGFNSKTTFNNVFKKITQQTPSQFRKNATN